MELCSVFDGNLDFDFFRVFRLFRSHADFSAVGRVCFNAYLVKTKTKNLLKSKKIKMSETNHPFSPQKYMFTNMR